MENGIAIVTKQGSITFWSKTAQSITGIFSAGVSEEDLWDIFLRHLENGSGKKIFPLREDFFKLLKEKNDVDFDAFFFHEQQSRKVYLNFTIFPYWEIKDVLKGSIVVFADGTRDFELEKMQDEWRHMLAHDLKSPLTSIIGANQILSTSKNLKAKEKRILRHGQESAKEMLELVNTFLDTTRINASKYPVKKETIELTKLLRRCTSKYKFMLKKKNIQLSTVVDDTFSIASDYALLSRVVCNLLDNAIKYTDKLGAIEIKIVSDHVHKVLFSVSDNGCGIDKKTISHIFEMFFQGKSKEKRSRSGAGLGLYFCHQAVALLGGGIWADSQKHKGTTISFILPKE